MTQIKLRRDTSTNFTSANPVLGLGEPAYETDTKKLKIGDGTTAYTQLEYFSAGGGGGSSDISAALPLKIVDGVISLEVDGQTIQIVDGKLHASNNIFDISKFTVVGSPTITDSGIASGFTPTGHDYVYYTFPKSNIPKESISIKSSTTLMRKSSNSSFIWCWNLNYALEISASGTIQLKYPKGTEQAPVGAVFPIHTSLSGLKDGDIANIITTVTPTKLSITINGQLFEKEDTVFFSYFKKMANEQIRIGMTNAFPDKWYSICPIDLKQFSITVDGKEVFNGLMNSTKPIYDAIKASNTELSEFKTETSNDFSAVDSALNEKANLSDLALKQNKLTAGDNITISADNVISATGGSAPTNMVTTDTAQTISGDKTLTGVTSISNNMRIAIGTKITTPSGQWLMQFNTGSIGIGTSMFPLQTFDGGDYYLRTRTVTAGNGIKVDDMGDGFIKISSAIENMAAYVTEEFIDGTEGYRIWSNGTCEQWGYKSGTNEETITFLKAFEDTNYNVVMATENPSRFFQGCYSNKTTTDMLISYTGEAGGSALGTSWMVTGNIDKGGDAGAK